MVKNIDSQRILENINTINKYLNIIKSRTKDNSKTENENDLEFKYLGLSMAFFTILNKLIKFGEELVDSLDKSYVPNTYIEIANILRDEKIFSTKQYKIYKSFIEYRNEIVHEYEQVSLVEIDWCLKNLEFIEDFIKIVKEKLLK